ncbi:MAG: carbohydrate ABC transporter permease [Ruminococcaceae bacterium]|nr:carbohydrate ABC transporter permease [Oscillospiraceae bacterium]
MKQLTEYLNRMTVPQKRRLGKVARFPGFLLTRFLYHGFLICTSFIMLYPVIYMLSMTFRPESDMNNPNVVWIPTSLTLGNIAKIWEYMDFPLLLRDTVILCVVTAIIQVIVCGIVGYGFARFNFKFKGLFTIILILTIIVPSQAVSIPNFLMYSNFDPLGLVSLINLMIEPNIKISLMDNPIVFYLPALFGMGMRSGIFILIYRQFFRNLPKELEDAASVDGCGPIRTFIRIMIPNCRPVIVVVALFSIVWHWNDSYYVSLYFDSFQTISSKLLQLSTDLNRLVGGIDAANPFTKAVWIQAGVALSILPMLIMYLFCQKFFVESVERSGLVG